MRFERKRIDGKEQRRVRSDLRSALEVILKYIGTPLFLEISMSKPSLKCVFKRFQPF